MFTSSTAAIAAFEARTNRKPRPLGECVGAARLCGGDQNTAYSVAAELGISPGGICRAMKDERRTGRCAPVRPDVLLRIMRRQLREAALKKIIARRAATGCGPLLVWRESMWVEAVLGGHVLAGAELQLAVSRGDMVAAMPEFRVHDNALPCGVRVS